MIKLIVSDMDGTLLNDEKKIAPGFYDLLPRLKERGIRFVVASGRQYPSLKQDFAEHIQDVTVIAENGAFVVDKGRELYFRGMDQEQLAHCLDAVATMPEVEPLLCAKYCAYTSDRELYELLAAPKFHYEMRLVDSLYGITEGVTKVSLIARSGMGAEACHEKLAPMLPEEVTLVVSGEGCLDTGLKGVHKGAAVAQLQKMWHITPEETVVFGDQFNDVEMFDQAAYSYAMENAVPQVRQKARFVAGSNNDGAVVKVIRELLAL